MDTYDELPPEPFVIPAPINPRLVIRAHPTSDDAWNQCLDCEVKSILLWYSAVTSVAHWQTSFILSRTIKGYNACSFNMGFDPDQRPYKDPADTIRFGHLSLKLRDGWASQVMISGSGKADLSNGVTVTLRDILTLSEEQGLQRFAFSSENSGCLCWQFTLMNALVKRGWLDAEVLERFAEYVKKREALPGSKAVIFLPPLLGFFYTVEEQAAGEVRITFR